MSEPYLPGLSAERTARLDYRSVIRRVKTSWVHCAAMELGEREPSGGLAYADPRYAASLREFGTPFELTRSGGWALRRPIPGTTSFDAMGCYPLFSCRDWSQLGADLDDLPDDMVSLTLITDPFGVPTEGQLSETFDVVRPYKDHLLIDLDRPAESVVARHHRKAARKGLGALTVEVYDPTTELPTWCDLYAALVAKHQVSGIPAFSPASFATQAQIPGLVGLKARLDDHVIGLHWYLTAGSVVYAHLVALHPDAYRLHADAAMIWTAIDLFSDRFRWIDMGAGSSAGGAADDGLTKFKAGWASDTAPTFVCGKIIDHSRYDELTRADHMKGLDYFPAYRYGEFSTSLVPAAP